MRIRDIIDADYAAILDLNRFEEAQTSPMDRDRLDYLVQLASFAKVVLVDDVVIAFILAINDKATYQNDNFGWFKSRLENFIYIDRIVVGEGSKSGGVGTLLYRSLIDEAIVRNLAWLSCEYNIEPPNEASRRFHDAFGFTEIGRQRVLGGTKLVSLQVMQLKTS
jgi:predicted GNAT superfamily acetyltransferase